MISAIVFPRCHVVSLTQQSLTPRFATFAKESLFSRIILQLQTAAAGSHLQIVRCQLAAQKKASQKDAVVFYRYVVKIRYNFSSIYYSYCLGLQIIIFCL